MHFFAPFCTPKAAFGGLIQHKTGTAPPAVPPASSRHLSGGQRYGRCVATTSSAAYESPYRSSLRRPRGSPRSRWGGCGWFGRSLPPWLPCAWPARVSALGRTCQRRGRLSAGPTLDNPRADHSTKQPVPSSTISSPPALRSRAWPCAICFLGRHPASRSRCTPL